jgi:hypothetical protein
MFFDGIISKKRGTASPVVSGTNGILLALVPSRHLHLSPKETVQV